MSPTIDAKKNRIQVDVDEKVFPRAVSIAAAYRFLDRCYVQLARAARGHLTISLKGKKKLARTRLDGLADELDNELLHQLMRHQVAEQTAGLREVLVGRALLSAEPIEVEPEEDSQQEESTDLDYLDDPLGIAVPWEEKYGDEGEGDQVPEKEIPKAKG